MKTRRWSTSKGLVAALCTFALAACGDGLQETAGPALTPQFTDGPGGQPWQLYVCKNGPTGTVAQFNVSATSGTVKNTNPLSVNAVETGISCVLAWEGAAGTPVVVTVTELLTPGMTLDRIVFNKSVPGTTVDGSTVTVSTEYFANSTVGGFAVVTFKNSVVDVPALDVVKSGAGTYDIPVRWELVKTVNPTSHTGVAGQNAGSSTWSVTATRIEGAPTNHLVTGTITVSNPANGITQTFSVSDNVNGVAATVNCPDYTLDAGETVNCTYSAAVAGATLNTAVVSSPGFPDVTATAAITYTSSFTGDETVTLADPRFAYSSVISSTTNVTFPETFPCPSDASLYVNGTYSYTVTNTATLKGNVTDLSRDATVNVTCTKPQNGETATGAGFPWSATQGAPSTWFMYTPWVTTGVHRGISATATSTQPAGTNLIAGQHYVAGRITGTRGTTTSITITLNSAWGFDGGQISNVKINPMSCTTGQPYVSPGKFTVHRTASASATSITVTGLPNTACYGIHADVVEK